MKLFSEAKGGACSLWGVCDDWGVQLGNIGGAGADRVSADCGNGVTGADLGEQQADSV